MESNGFDCFRKRLASAPNADFGISKKQKVEWILTNAIRNSLMNRGMETSAKAFLFLPAGPTESAGFGGKSPSRWLCDQFWESLPWGEVSQGLGGSVDVLDLGCGEGRLSDKLKTFLGKRLRRYLGVDISSRPSWAHLLSAGKVEFSVLDLNEAAPDPPVNNLVVSQSVLEHLRNDGFVIKKFGRNASLNSPPSIQIHLVPGPASLWDYLWHGYRQYSFGDIDRLTEGFPANTQISLVAMGGPQLSKVHRKFIRNPAIRKQTDRRVEAGTEYDRAAREGLTLSPINLPARHVMFWAIVIESNFAESAPIRSWLATNGHLFHHWKHSVPNRH